MKKITLILALGLLSALHNNAQNPKYIEVMKKNIAQIDTVFLGLQTKTKTIKDLYDLAGKFERIARTEKNQWLPYYYAAYCNTNAGFYDKPEANDGIAKRSEEWLNKADSLSPKNSEIQVVRAMNNTLFMMVNPQQRFMEYGGKISKNNKDAEAYDPTNPRTFLFQAMNIKNTPAQFGGGCKPAMVMLIRAKELFKIFKPTNELNPNWGLPILNQLISECEKAK